ncbi:hypothetical protein A6V39_02845 [Candidatus Mycoplasma haematobovis]|uniref:Trigger factor C-terminal domain-containing protein n=1 Tax=Candidatus Mycoplasma haematobovis TaxID=432608 RepID=A0A1A9QF75_9MOLU|nr:hypothetical protein [Candidatus Mycoplasma haematobovis]OAL10350.1 hypothetical protein A6V39_02845 [Candidatus Mycoplasma haematobovis]
MKSAIKTKKPIKFGKTILINRLMYSEGTKHSIAENIKRHNPEITDEALEQEVMAHIRRDNRYNAVMDEVASAYEFTVDEEEVSERIAVMKEEYPEGNDEAFRNSVLISIYKKLIYQDLANDWELQISDDEVRITLESYYKSTGNPIREYLTNRERFEEVRETLIEQVVTDRLLNAFKVEFNLEREN